MLLAGMVACAIAFKECHVGNLKTGSKVVKDKKIKDFIDRS